MFGMAIHGGAGTLPRAEMSGEAERRYRAGLEARRSMRVTRCCKTAAPAWMRSPAPWCCSRTIRCSMPAAARCSPSTAATNWTPRSWMGGNLRAGAVCGLTRIKNPMQLARAVMERSEHVMLAGAGAEEFAVEPGLFLRAAKLFLHRRALAAIGANSQRGNRPFRATPFRMSAPSAPLRSTLTAMWPRRLPPAA